MKKLARIIAVISLPLVAAAAIAETTRDCVLEGTVQKGGSGNPQDISVKINSVGKYDEDAKCPVRSGQKMEFKLPADPRLQDAAPGSKVKYRYRSESDGTAKSDLISVGT